MGFTEKLKILIDKYLLSVFLVFIFFIKLPPFYVLPIQSRIFSSHTLAKMVFFFIFTYLIFVKIKDIKGIIQKNKLLFGIIAAYLVSQSISVFAALDISLFWRSYHNTLASLAIFFISFYLTLKGRFLKKFTKFILLTGTILSILELVFILFPNYVILILQALGQKEIVDAYLANISRVRYSLDMNLELFLPFFLGELWMTKNIYLKTRGGIFSLLIIFLSFISNFRSRVVMSVFSSFFFLFIKLKDMFSKVKSVLVLRFFVVLVLIIVTVLLSVRLSNSLFTFNVLDRFTLQDEREDLDTIIFRISAARRSLEMFFSSPLIGVGSGNYYVYSDKPDFALRRYLNNSSKAFYEAQVAYSPHNILFQTIAETGAIGIVSLVFLLIYFFVKDVKFLLHRQNMTWQDIYIISYWTLLTFAMFNPAYTIYVVGWAWFIRGVAEGNYVRIYSTLPTVKPIKVN